MNPEEDLSLDPPLRFGLVNEEDKILLLDLIRHSQKKWAFSGYEADILRSYPHLRIGFITMSQRGANKRLWLICTGLLWEVVTLVESDPDKRERMFFKVGQSLRILAEVKYMDMTLRNPLKDNLRSMFNRLIFNLKSDWAIVDGHFLQPSRFQLEYKNLGLIEKGGYALVYKVRNKLDGNCYALKVIPFRFKTREAFEIIKREIRIFASLKPHPNLVAYKTSWLEKWISGSKSNVFKTAKLACPEGSQTKTDTNSDSTTQSSSECETTDESSDSCSDAPDPEVDPVVGSREDIEIIELITHVIKSEAHVINDDVFLNNPLRDYASGSKSSDGFDFGASLYILMELCDKNLKTWMDERNDGLVKLSSQDGQKKQLVDRIDLTECLKIFKEMLVGLKVIHKNQLIHRDLKPQNILFGLDGRIKISDFGLATTDQCKENSDSAASATQALDVEYTVGLGTSAYAAPEQLKKADFQYDRKVDIYSLGMVAFELFHPFVTNMERARAFEDLRRNHSVPQGFIERMPQVAKMILRMTSPLPKDRPDASEILRFALFKQDQCNVVDGQGKEVTILKSQLLEKEDEIRRLKEENDKLQDEIKRLKALIQKS